VKRPRSYPTAGLLGAVVLGVLGAFLRPAPAAPQKDAERPHGIPKRTPWTTSRLTGSPEPPPPYKIERAFPKLSFKNPLQLATAPGVNRFFVAEHMGKVYSFPFDPKVEKADLFLDPAAELHSWEPKGKVKGIDTVYAVAFHPQFAKNRYCYVCYVLHSKSGEQLPDGTRVSRFRVTDANPPRCDPKSEKILITWLAGGHNGCDMHFGPDGYLYISTGDGTDPNPPDRLLTGQDVTDLLSSILRIDVDREENGKAYAIPPDNPFTPDEKRAAVSAERGAPDAALGALRFPLYVPRVRPEIWAYGFRNPWRMSFDRATGDLWVGDVGWELWEMVYRVQKGGNYGWSVMEGRQPVRPDSRRGPTPILPPALDFPHTEAASITGGYVYRGKRLPDLVGAYVCGDWVTRKLWGTRFDGDKVVSHRELAQGTQRVVAFGEDKDRELYFLDYDEKGYLYQLVPNEAKDTSATFPRKLSETGLFTSAKDQTPALGVVPFSVNAEQWMDHAIAERFVALPGTATAQMYDHPIPIPGGFFSGDVYFPRDGVLARTVSLELERGNPRSRRRLETQVLHYDGTAWHGYTYRWNDAQTDADLVPAGGANQELNVVDAKAPGGKRKQTWHFPSRAECMTCHNPWVGHTLAFTLAQLNKDHDYGGVTDNQLRAYHHAGLISYRHRDEGSEKEKVLDRPPDRKLTSPHDASAKLEARARSYLHVNCAHCHRFGAGGTADFDLRADNPIGETKALKARPVQGTFDIAGGQILAPGDPYHSVLYYRMAKLGRGRMPHIGSEIVDERGLRLVRDWIAGLGPHREEGPLLDKLRSLAGPAAPAAERDEVVRRLLSATDSALMLADALGDDRIPASVREQVLAAAEAWPDPQVRDLFERFVPDERRVKRLGSVIRPEQILSLKGDPAKGKELFFKSAGLQCVNCHRIHGTGTELGPDLSQIGKKLTRAQLLESILEPSKTIDPQYVAYTLETTDGQVHTGLLGARNDREVVLKLVGDKEVRVPAKKVQSLAPQRTSLMPEQLLRDATAEQAADLIEFLASLK
jgi:uncharacterized repeat protein (TIGR03806 family)